MDIRPVRLDKLLEKTMIPDIAVGAIIAAIIAGIISLIGLIISKENKVSEFRQKWIDDFREDIALILSEALIINAYIYNKPSLQNDFINISKENYSTFNSALSRTRLRTNPDEPLSNELLNALTELDRVLELDSKYRVSGDTKKCEDKILELSRVILKIEWSRVKIGEKVYSLTVRLIATSVICFIALSLIVA